MRQSDCTALEPANDNRDWLPMTGDLFSSDVDPIFFGMDLSFTKDVTVISHRDRDGRYVIDEVIEGDAEPKTEIGKAVYAAECP